LYSRLMNVKVTDISPSVVQQLVSISQNQGGLSAVGNYILTSDDYLQTFGDFMIPGQDKYLPCTIQPRGLTASATAKCDADHPDSHTVEAHVPRGYQLLIPSGHYSQTTTKDYGSANFCPDPRSVYLTATARPSGRAFTWICLSDFNIGVDTNASISLTWSGQYVGYSFSDLPVHCAKPAAPPDWASVPPVVCGAGISSPSTCTISATDSISVNVYAMNRCYQKGANITSLTFRQGDAQKINSPTAAIYVEYKRSADRTFFSAISEKCSGTIALPQDSPIVKR
jgi:hypothetical protein